MDFRRRPTAVAWVSGIRREVGPSLPILPSTSQKKGTPAQVGNDVVGCES